MSPNGPKRMAITSTSTGMVWAPWRYLGVWKMYLYPSLASGCAVRFTSAQGFTTLRPWRTSQERSSRETPYASGPLARMKAWGGATMTLGS